MYVKNSNHTQLVIRRSIDMESRNLVSINKIYTNKQHVFISNSYFSVPVNGYRLILF